jgi:hypothetical protein
MTRTGSSRREIDKDAPCDFTISMEGSLSSLWISLLEKQAKRYCSNNLLVEMHASPISRRFGQLEEENIPV